MPIAHTQRGPNWPFRNQNVIDCILLSLNYFFDPFQMLLVEPNPRSPNDGQIFSPRSNVSHNTGHRYCGRCKTGGPWSKTSDKSGKKSLRDTPHISRSPTASLHDSWLNLETKQHMGREAELRLKKSTIPKLNVFICTLVVGITSQNFKIGPLGDFEKTRFCVFFWPKNTFWGPIRVPKVCFWGFWGLFCIEKWSQNFDLGTRSAIFKLYL